MANCCKNDAVGKWFRGPLSHLCSVYFLYYWGENMWNFALGLYLVYFEEGLLRLAAIFGFATAGSVFIFGGLLGNWLDKTKRLASMRIIIFVQDISVAIFSIIVFFVVRYEDSIKTTWGGALWTLLAAIIIIFAIIAQLFGMIFKIALERDWFVVVADGDAALLAEMNSVTRSLDQLTMLLAPVVAGAIMTHVSLQVAALIIVGYSLVTVFIKYILLLQLYKQVPGLARVKKNEAMDDVIRSRDLQETNEILSKARMIRSEDELNNSANSIQKDTLEVNTGTDVNQDAGSKQNLDAPNSSTKIEDIQETSSLRGSKINLDAPKDPSDNEDARSQTNLDAPDSSKYEEMEVEEPDEQASDKQKEEEKLDDSETSSQSLHSKSASGNLAQKLCEDMMVLYSGWRVYARQKVVLAGVGLAFLYMTVLAFHTITIGYAYANGISESALGILSVFAGIAGILGSVLYPILWKRLGLERTGIFGFWFEICCLVLPVISIWLPGSPYQPGFLMSDRPETTTCIPPVTGAYGSNTTTQYADMCGTEAPKTVVTPAIIVFLIGVILSRMGLWIADLAVAQLMQENVKETERGVVNGVQNSLNMLFEIAKYVLVIILPYVETYGILVILSFIFVATGGILFLVFVYKTRADIFPCHKDESSKRHYQVAGQVDV